MRKHNKIRRIGLVSPMLSGKTEFSRKRRLKKLVPTFLSYRTSWEGVQMTLIRIMLEKLMNLLFLNVNQNSKTKSLTNL